MLPDDSGQDYPALFAAGTGCGQHTTGVPDMIADNDATSTGCQA